MTIKEAINELVDYVAENDKLTISFETVTMARKALEVQEKLQEMVKTLESNLSCTTTCSAIDLSNECEQAKYQAYYKCLTHLKEILEIK